MRTLTFCLDLTHRGSRKQTKYDILIFWIFFAEYKDDQCFQEQLFFDIVNIRDNHAGDTEVAHMPVAHTLNNVVYKHSSKLTSCEDNYQTVSINMSLHLDNHDIDLDNLDPTFWERKSFQGGFQLGGFYECASSLQYFFFFWPSGIYDCLWLVCFTCAPSVD